MSCEEDPKEFADIGREGPGHQIQVPFWRYLIEERDDIEAHMDVVGSKVHNSKFTKEFVKYFDVASSPSLWSGEWSQVSRQVIRGNSVIGQNGTFEL